MSTPTARFVCVELFGRSDVADDRALLRDGSFRPTYCAADRATFATHDDALAAGRAARGRRDGALLSAFEAA